MTGGQVIDYRRSRYRSPEVKLWITGGQDGFPEVLPEPPQYGGHRDQIIQAANSLKKLGDFIKISKFTEPSF